MALRIHLRQIDNRVDRGRCLFDKLPRQNLSAAPPPLPQVQVADARHGIDVGMDTRAELPSADSVDLVGPICIVPPPQVGAPDA